MGGKSERVVWETVEGAGEEKREGVWPEGVARVAPPPGYTLRALVGFSPSLYTVSRSPFRTTYTHERACRA